MGQNSGHAPGAVMLCSQESTAPAANPPSKANRIPLCINASVFAATCRCLFPWFADSHSSGAASRRQILGPERVGNQVCQFPTPRTRRPDGFDHHVGAHFSKHLTARAAGSRRW